MRKKIDPARAVALRAEGVTWKEVAAILTVEQDRASPLRSESVQGAVFRAFGTVAVRCEARGHD